MIKVAVSSLKDPVRKLSGVINAKGFYSFSGFIFIDTQKGVMRADNGSTSIVCNVPEVKSTEVSSFAIEGDKLAKVLNGFKDDQTLSIKVEGEGRAIVSCGRSRFTLGTLPVDEFPPMPSLQKPLSITINREHFMTALRDVLPFVAVKDVRPALNGIYIEAGERVLMTGTNGHVLSHVSVKAEALSESAVPVDSFKVIAQPEAARIAISSMESEWVYLMFAERMWGIYDGSTTVLGRTIEGEYPEYSRIISSSKSCKSISVSIPTVDINLSLSRIKPFSPKKVLLDQSGDGLLAIKGDSEHGVDGAVDVLPVEYKAERIAFSIKYLESLVKTCHGEEMRVSIPTNNAGFLVSEEQFNDIEKTQIVCPIRL